MKKEIMFEYGAMSDTLEKQANEQGFTLGRNAEKLEKIKTSITMCMFHVATESQVKLMRVKLHKMVLKSCKMLKDREED